ncbi:protein Bouncer-like [Denticeps clupeoides]|uniref:UPAR/Ly6 domain-containing protein n=1 Tax=Denticeps clupeoides TaxID=299321 RepID=A0AAY4BK88_9TELE|nr:protein Bouncer-like [Denticeps clupeoides]
MIKVLVGVLAVIASAALVESLTCNYCSVGVVGVCLIPSSITCPANQTNCFTGKASFSGISFLGFNSQGCMASSTCNTTTTGSVLGASFTSVYTCCSSNSCNPTQNAAPSTYVSMSFTAVSALLATVWASGVY